MKDTRSELLEAGVRLYGTMAAELLRGLTAGTVAKEAGFHRQTFYRYWETQAQYVQELLRHVLGTEDAPVADGASHLVEHPTDLESFVKDLAEHDFVRVAEDDGARMRVGLLATDALNQPPLSGLIQQFYDTSIQRLQPGYEAMLDGVGRQPAGSATVRDLVRVVQALLLGLVLQAKAAGDEDPHAAVLFEWGVLALLEGLTEPVDDARSA